jgi:hypothetical protein
MFDDLRPAVKGLIVYGVLLKPLPFDAPERLVAVPSVKKTEAADAPGDASVSAKGCARRSSCWKTRWSAT